MSAPEGGFRRSKEHKVVNKSKTKSFQSPPASQAACHIAQKVHNLPLLLELEACCTLSKSFRPHLHISTKKVENTGHHPLRTQAASSCILSNFNYGKEHLPGLQSLIVNHVRVPRASNRSSGLWQELLLGLGLARLGTKQKGESCKGKWKESLRLWHRYTHQMHKSPKLRIYYMF